MTPFVPFADGAQGQLHYLYAGEPVSNRIWLLDRFPPTLTSEYDQAADGLRAWCEEQLLIHLGNDLLFLGASVSDWSASPSPYVAYSPSTAVGGSPDRSHSANVAYRVLFRGDSSQSFKDNAHFLPGIPLGAIAGNTINPSFTAAIFDAYVDLIDRTGTWSAGNKWRWVVASSWLDGSLRPSLDVARTDFIAVSDPYSTQRRRRIPR